MKKLLLLAAVLAVSVVAIVAFVAGCSRNDGPSVNLVTTHFKEATALETTMEFVIRVGNDEPEAKKFTGSAHKVYINGLYVGSGLSDQLLEVPRLGSVTQAVTVHLSNLALVTRVKSVIESESFDFRLASTFYGESALSRTRTETVGKLALKDFMPTESSSNEPPAKVEQPPAK
jgi:LEA14-like dessication related protein